MNDFIHLPPYENNLSQWINFNQVEVIKKQNAEEVLIIFTSGKKEVYTSIWARIILAYLDEPKFYESKNYQYFEDETL